MTFKTHTGKDKTVRCVAKQVKLVTGRIVWHVEACVPPMDASLEYGEGTTISQAIADFVNRANADVDIVEERPFKPRRRR